MSMYTTCLYEDGRFRTFWCEIEAKSPQEALDIFIKQELDKHADVEDLGGWTDQGLVAIVRNTETGDVHGCNVQYVLTQGITRSIGNFSDELWSER